MGTSSKKRSSIATASSPSVPETEARLLDDVKRVVRELGFAGTPYSPSDQAFDDFAPEAGKKKLTKTQRGRKKDNRKGKGEGDDTETNHDEKKKGNKSATTQTKGDDGKQGRATQANPPQKMITNAADGNMTKTSFGNSSSSKPGSASSKAGSMRPRSILPSGEMGPWWDVAATRDTRDSDSAGEKKTRLEDTLLDEKRKMGEKMLENEVAAFQAAAERERNGSNLQWLHHAHRGGTTSDKVAAMAVLVQESPVANLKCLDGLIKMVEKKGGARAVVGTALDALRELWIDVLLPPDRKLKFLQQQHVSKLPNLSHKDADVTLLMWCFEDEVKRRYATFVEALDVLTRDALDFVKDRAVKTVFDLLVARPEQESQLLSILVNKLGDPQRKLASKAGYLLTKLLAVHPGMKHVAVREIERFVFRPGLADRARYYAVIYLNQIVLTHQDKNVRSGVKGSAGGSTLARKLVDLYFTLFKLIIEGRLGTSASLAAAEQEKENREAQKRASKRGKKSASSLQRNKEEKKAAGSEDEASFRPQKLPGEVDSRMLAALITGVRRAFPYVAADEVEPLIEANTDALFRLIHTGSFGVATQALLLLYQLMSARNAESDRFYRALYATLMSSELVTSTKAPMYLSLLFKAIKADVLPRRAAAFVKRLLQVSVEAPSQFACGCLFMLSELLKSMPALWNGILQPEDKEEDGLEHFDDVDGNLNETYPRQEDETPSSSSSRSSVDGDDEVELQGNDVQRNNVEKSISMGNSAARENGQLRHMRGNVAVAETKGAFSESKWPSSGGSGYDMRKRDPQYANADRTCLWELLLLASHAHPSVAAMARTLLAGASVSYFGDPLRDLTLSAFLDKFVEKKAKKGAATRGDSLMQPLRSGPTTASQGLMLEAAFKHLASKDIAPDDDFFHKFYSLQAASIERGQFSGSKKRKDGATAASDDAESIESGDSAEIDALLDAEEEGGKEGLGADPDRALAYDYAALAEAMAESSDLPSSAEEDVSSLDLDGAEFSEISSDVSSQEDGGEEISGSEGHSDRIDDRDARDGSSEDDDTSDDSLIDSMEDPSDDAEDDASDIDDDAADAEVSALLKALGDTRCLREDGNAHEDEATLDVNPFDIAEGGDTSDDSNDEGEPSDLDDAVEWSDISSDDPALDADSIEDKRMMSTRRNGKRRKVAMAAKDAPVFASADEYLDMIEKDLAKDGMMAPHRDGDVEVGADAMPALAVTKRKRKNRSAARPRK